MTYKAPLEDILFALNTAVDLPGMIERGVYLAPSGWEVGFVSAAHSDADIDTTVAAAAETFKSWS